jgi:class 3 adenylate cyclase
MTTEQRARTRAFLFADLRGYSAFTERHGDAAAADLIGRYRRLVREQIAAFDGAEIRTEGDSFYVVFDSVGDAVHAGLAIRDAVGQADDGRGAPIRVGIGIHAGEARDGEQGIVSSAVNIAARVCAIAEPGEVLVSETVRGLTRTALLVGYTPHGRRRLKGIAEPIALFRAESSAASGTVPVPRPRRAPWPIAVGGGLAAAAVVVALVASRGGAEGEPSPSGSTVTSPAASAAATHDLSRFSDPGPFPNANETALRDQLLSSVGDRCERADPDDTPLFHFLPEEGYPQSTYPLRNRAGLDCLVDGIRVQYWQAVGSGGSSAHIGFASDLFFNTVRRLSLTSGDCATQSQVHEPWEAGAHDGRLLCYVGTDGPVIAWTFDEQNIYATARLRSGSSSELYTWWLDTGRLLGR